MRTSSLARRLLAALILTLTAGSATTIWLAACHETYRPPTVASYQPLHREAFVKGELGIVQPTFARRYLLQAYRVLNSAPPLDAQILGPAPARVFAAGQQMPRTSIEEWRDARRQIPGLESPPQFDTVYYDDSSVGRSIKNLYSTFPNCQSDAFRTATRTLEQRMATFRNNPTAVIEWMRAQDAVFANCSGEQLVLPQPPGSWDPQLRADFEYQTAAAYFYATQYRGSGKTIPADRRQPSVELAAIRPLSRCTRHHSTSDGPRELRRRAQ